MTDQDAGVRSRVMCCLGMQVGETSGLILR